MKLDKETGEIVPLTEDEIRLKKLIEELEALDSRLQELESSWEMYKEKPESENDKWEISSDDSMMKHSSTLAGNSVSKGQIS